MTNDAPGTSSRELEKEVRRLRREIEQLRRVGHAYETVGDQSRHLADSISRRLESQIDENHRTVEALMEAKERAEQAVESKRLFFDNLSHEIRTPLNGVIGMAEVLLDGTLDAGQRDSVETICRCGQELLELVNDILDFSQLEAGKVNVDAISFELGDLVRDVQHQLARSAEAKGIQLEAEIEEPGRLLGDRSRLRQVLMNLVENGIKFTSRGSVVVRLEMLDSRRLDATVRLSVLDTGIGIESQDLDRIFYPFTQADSTTTRRFGGTGLGLAISRQIVELMGGTVAVQSTPGVGSTFVVNLTLPRSRRAVRRSPSSQGRRTLVLSSSGSLRQEATRMLRQSAVPHDSAVDVSEALEILGEAFVHGNPYEVVLVDGVLRDGTAARFARVLRDDPRLTDLVLVGLGADAATADFDGAVPVPLRRQDLLHLLQTSPEPPPSPLEAPETLRARVLLVEDNLVNQRVISRQLEKLGCHVVVIDDGELALDALERTDFDLVLMDLQMPGMDGYQTTAAIRNGPTRLRNIPIVALTAHATPADRDRGTAVGVDETLVKPIDAATLRRTLNRWAAEPV